MNASDLKRMIQQLREGTLDADTFIQHVKTLPFQDLGEVKLDTHRALRKGFAEIVYCPNKSEEQLQTIAEALSDSNENILFSRATLEQYKVVANILPDAHYHEKARIIGIKRRKIEPVLGLAIISAGSSDVPVAEEAAVTAEYMGCTPKRLYDIGIAALHRLLAHIETLQTSLAIVAVAGMEGALPSVLAGLVSCPVIGVPTSTGYGANLGGIAPLLTMLNSCATGVAVVNIDNGLGAGYLAGRIVLQATQK
ncbi:MAG TPA: nickel pincer cofactor biosynthesis protein LarB [Aminobacterium sp.]|nr:nickel pincer cofactor biosynthesis protein LarB [Aminobacterium sp.]